MGLNREVWDAKHSQLRFPSRTEKELHIARTAGLEPISSGQTKGPNFIFHPYQTELLETYVLSYIYEIG